MDKSSFTVLETLQRMMGSSDDVMGGWFYAITIAQAIGDDVESILDEYDLLDNEGLIEMRSAPDNARIGMLARVSRRGAAVLAEARKQRRLLAAAPSPANGRDTERIIVREKSDLRTYDVFISYASEDREYALALRSALADQSISVWMDLDVVRLGDDILRSIDEGVRQSSHAILLLSPHYIRKRYPTAEFASILKRQIDERGNVILPLLHGGLSQAALAEFSSFLSSLRNIETDQASTSTIVGEIMRVVKPPIVTVITPTNEDIEASHSHDAADAGQPLDALEDDPRLGAFRPRLNITGFTLIQRAPDDADLSYDVVNVGNGTACKIRIFLPGLRIDSPQGPIQAGSTQRRSVKYSDREAFVSHMPIYAQVIAEFEDIAGNLYRQYARPHQPAASAGRFSYDVEEFNRPYLVPRRIVDEDPRDTHFRRIAR
jgi:hypothetical protein